MTLAKDLAGVIATEIAHRAGIAFESGAAACAADGFPLNERQRIELGSALIVAFDGMTDAIAHTIGVDALLRTVGVDGL